MSASIAIFHAFARSGGTLVNQLLGCNSNIVVLSEVSPSASVASIDYQLTTWHGLLRPEDSSKFNQLSYLDKIIFAHNQATAAGKNLCIRDWPTPYFLPNTTQDSEPSFQLENLHYLLRSPLDIKTCAILRRSADVYTSLVRNIPSSHNLSVSDFIAAYEIYLQRIISEHIPRFYLENICAAPLEQINSICSTLNLPSITNTDGFHKYQMCTGNNSLPTPPVSAKATLVTPGTATRSSNPAFQAIDQLAGYEN